MGGPGQDPNQRFNDAGEGYNARGPAFHDRYNSSVPGPPPHGGGGYNDGMQEGQQSGDRFNDERGGPWGGRSSPQRDGNAGFEGGPWRGNGGGGGGMMEGGDGGGGSSRDGGPGFNNGGRMHGPGGPQDFNAAPPLQPPPPPAPRMMHASSPPPPSAPALSAQVCLDVGWMGGKGERCSTKSMRCRIVRAPCSTLDSDTLPLIPEPQSLRQKRHRKLSTCCCTAGQWSFRYLLDLCTSGSPMLSENEHAMRILGVSRPITGRMSAHFDAFETCLGESGNTWLILMPVTLPVTNA